ncbi:MAG: DUF222 domain-containing protein [Solirubrobacteraceae bacterium]
MESTGVGVDALRGDLAGLADEQLEAGICGFASRIAAATYLFLRAVGEYDRRQAWAAWECTSMAAWLAWKCAISPTTAREQVRVATALASLRLVAEKFSAGELSYSQVRAVSRVATPASEAQLVELAAVMTAGQLDKVLGAYRRTKAEITDTARRRDARRHVRWGHDDDGCVVGTFRLAPEEGALLTGAIESRLTRSKTLTATGRSTPTAR